MSGSEISRKKFSQPVRKLDILDRRFAAIQERVHILMNEWEAPLREWSALEVQLRADVLGHKRQVDQLGVQKIPVSEFGVEE